MRRLIALAMLVAASISLTPAIAQERQGNRDPKARTERIAEKLNFTAEQKAKLQALNEQYSGENFDRKQYHEAFKAILTDEQKQQLEEMRARRMEERRGKDDAEKM